jgi:hypothetical protein
LLEKIGKAAVIADRLAGRPEEIGALRAEEQRGRLEFPEGSSDLFEHPGRGGVLEQRPGLVADEVFALQQTVRVGKK